MSESIERKYTESDCILALQQAEALVDGSLTQKKYRECEISPSFQTPIRIFGSWNEAKQAAGLDTYGCSINEDYFKEIDTEEKAYWLGFILGDGCLAYRDDQEIYTLGIGLSLKDKSHLDEFVEAVKSDYSVSVNREKEYPSCQTSIVNQEFCKSLLSWGITPEKTHSDSFPSTEFDHAVVRGLFDADGYQDGDNWEITGASKSRFKDIQSRLPVDSSIEPSKDSYYRLRVHTSERRDELIDWLYPEGNETQPSLSRKHL